MTLSRKILSVLTTLTLGVTMTMPLQVALELPGAITESQPPSLGYRTGVVTAVVESNNITVAISGSNVLVTASYLFPQYLPMPGDRVYVIKQEGQWFVLGMMSGPINTVVTNPSFEEGVVGAVPTGWTLTNTLVAAGVPTFTKQAGNGFSAVSGEFVGFAELLVATASNISVSNIRSTVTPTLPGTNWTLGVYFSASVTPIPNCTVFVTGYIEFLDGGGGILASFATNTATVEASFLPPIRLRPDQATLPGAYATAPAGTVSVRAMIDINYNMTINGSANVKLDYVELRQVP